MRSEDASETSPTASAGGPGSEQQGAESRGRSAHANPSNPLAKSVFGSVLDRVKMIERIEARALGLDALGAARTTNVGGPYVRLAELASTVSGIDAKARDAAFAGIGEMTSMISRIDASIVPAIDTRALGLGIRDIDAMSMIAEFDRKSAVAGIDAVSMMTEFHKTSVGLRFAALGDAASINSGVDAKTLGRGLDRLGDLAPMVSGIDAKARDAAFAGIGDMISGIDAQALGLRLAGLGDSASILHALRAQRPPWIDNLAWLGFARPWAHTPEDDHAATADDVLTISSVASRLAAVGLDDSAYFLFEAQRLVDESDDERDFAIAVHHAVGALEEMACQVALKATGRLPGALVILVRRGVVRPEDAARMKQAYHLRNTTRGAGHGAGACPREVALTAIHRVLQGFEVLLLVG